MTWTHGVQEVSESGATNIFRSLVCLPVVENAMVVGTTLEVVVETRDRREIMQAQATRVLANMRAANKAMVELAVVAQATVVVAVVVAQAAMEVAVVAVVVAQATVAVAVMAVVVAQATVAVAVVVVEHQCLTI